MKSFPIRLRLTFWYFLMFAFAALLLSFTSWCMLGRIQDATIHQDLQEKLDDVRIQLRQMGPGLTPQAAQSQFAAVYRFRDEGKWLQIVDQQGLTLYRSPRMASLIYKAGAPKQLAGGEQMAEANEGPRPIRLLTATINQRGRTYRVAIGISMKKEHALLRAFSLDLLLLTPGVLLLAAAGGHFMSRKALTPVARIAHQARRITDRNLDTRLPVSSTNDEVSHLSSTLNHMLARIDKAFHSVREFTANASHELRTPLARLRSEVEVALLRPRTAAQYRQSLENAHQSVVEMSILVDNLLSLARAESAGETLHLVPVDLRPLLQEIAEEWSPIAHRCSLRFEIRGLQSCRIGQNRIAEHALVERRSDRHAIAGYALAEAKDEPLLVLGDRLSLLRLLRIWLDNACKFTPPGGRVALTLTSTPGAFLLAVEDTGISIAPQHQARIFDRFYRVARDTGSEITGSGLGLSLAAWIAEQHKTHISLDSAARRGSRFEVSLPRIPPDTILF